MSLPPSPPADRILLEEELPGGAMWSLVVRRHHTLRFIDLDGGANVGVMLYNRDLLGERYNMPDTLKAQHTAFLTQGRALYSDMGRVLCSVSADSCGWHDTVCGHLDAAGSAAKYGVARYQEQRNLYHRNAHDSFLVELGKWGLGAAGSGGQPEPLLQGERPTPTAGCASSPATAPPAATSICGRR